MRRRKLRNCQHGSGRRRRIKRDKYFHDGQLAHGGDTLAGFKAVINYRVLNMTKARTRIISVMLQKPPIIARKTWRTKPVIRDAWMEPIAGRIHIHQKPFELQALIIVATTNPYDTVMDPVAGSFSVWTAAAQEGRHFFGDDLLGAPPEFVAPAFPPPRGGTLTEVDEILS
jgi:DNA methylase